MVKTSPACYLDLLTVRKISFLIVITGHVWQHERIPPQNGYHIIWVGCLFPHLSAAQKEIMSNKLISAAQSQLTDCMFSLFILFYAGFNTFSWLFCLFVSPLLFPFLWRASLLTIRSKVSPLGIPCVWLCVSSYGFRMLWSQQCVAGRGPECDSLSRSHRSREQSCLETVSCRYTAEDVASAG